MKAAVKKADAVLEPELRELCDQLNGAQRRKTAEKFARWANQLVESVMVMEPGAIPLLPPPKVPRGFFLVNLPRSDQKELRALAREAGVPLNVVIRWAITRTRMELKERQRAARLLGVRPNECWKFVCGSGIGRN